MIGKTGRSALRGLAIGLITAVMTALMTTTAWAGPPFLTDDPEPVELHHYEFYTFSTLDRSGGAYTGFFPAFEFNAGVAPNTQFHIIAPLAYSVVDSGPKTYGFGDIELGLKYRFLQEKKWRPQAGVFPFLELPTGDSNRGLGNGQTWAQLPLWLQKSWGKGWTSYGGIGYVINHAPGMRDHIYAGWQAQRDLSKKLTLGVEWFDPGRASVDGQGSQLINAGGFYNFNPGFSLLFTAGHSFHGEAHTVAYLGLYWTWGPKESGGSAKLAPSLHPWHAGGPEF